MNPDAWDSWLTAAVWSEPLHRLGQTFLHSLWQGAAAAAVLAVALRVLPRRSAVAVQIRYGLATLALVALPAAALVTYAFTEPPAGAVARQPVAESRGAGGGTPVASGRNETRPTPAATPRAVAGGVPDLFVGAPRVIESCLPWCGCAWLLGVALAALRVATGCSVTRRLVAGAAAPLDPRWQARLRGWQRALGIGRRIRLLVSAQVDVPMVVGWARPVVLWPLTACVGLSPDQLDAILVHELAHVRRHDVLVNILQAWIEAVFFHHPAAWWISAQVRAEREYCADEMAVRVLDAGRGEARPRQARRTDTRLAYARALVAIEERRQRAVLAVAADGGSLVRRVHRLVAVEPATGHSGRFAAALVAALTVGGAWAVPAMVAGRDAIAADAGDPAAQPLPAGAMPKDTNAIQRLTLEQAETLATTFAGATATISLSSGLVISNHYRSLPLNGLESLDAETAAALAGWNRGPLLLNGLKVLDAATAEALGGVRGPLWFAGLTTLDIETARALSAGAATQLGLTGLTRLDAATAEALAEYGGRELRLDGLTALDAATAAALAKSKGLELHLGGLTTLDVETARALAAANVEILNLSGLTRLDPEAARALAGFAVDKPGQGRHAGLILLQRLSSATQLDVETARMLAAIPKWPGELDQLTTLDAPVAEALAAFKGPQLSFDAIKELDAETARALAAYGGALSLPGVTTLDPDIARALAAKKGGALALPGLKTLGGDAARALAGLQGVAPYFSGLTTLDAETAKVLVGLPGFSGHLGQLRRLDAATARVLGQFKGDTLYLARLPALDAEAARELAAFKGQALFIQSVTTLDAEVARALAGFQGKRLELGGPHTLDPSAVEALMAIPSASWGTHNITALDPDTARAFVEFSKLDSIGFRSLKTLDAATARVLASRRWATLDLSSLSTFDADTARALSEFKGATLRLHGLTTLNADVARTLAAIPGWDGQLEMPRAIDADTARALAGHQGKSMYFPGLTTLDADAARALADFKGDHLFLNNLTRLDADAVWALAEYDGELKVSPQALSGFMATHSLDAATARAYATLSGGSLPMITALESPDSVAIAEAFATYKPPLRLPNLKRISPKTLATLLQKDNLEIPLIETLALIPEPDGSPTEDFLIPEDFKQQQRR